MSTVTCSTCGTESPAGKKFCADCGTPLSSPASPQPATAPDPTRPSPAAPLVSPSEERRLVTALFCDLVGFTPLSESLDPEEVREVQAAYFSAVAAQVERYGGIVEKYAGDAVLALFGVPMAHEDDPERAVLCALGMQGTMEPVAEEMWRRYQVRVAIRVGVNTGEVVSGSWNASGQQQAAVTGDAVNTAARLQAAAEPGGVLVGEETMRLARRRIRFGPRQELVLKGKAAPFPSYAVLGLRDRTGERSEGDDYAGPLIGRRDELDVIEGAWARVEEGSGRLLTIVGEPGVGKSRLLAEAHDRLTGAGTVRVLWGRCLSYGQSISLWLIADLLRSFFGLTEEDRPDTVGARVAAGVEEVLQAHDETDRAIARDLLGEVLGLPAGGSLVAQAGPQIRRQSLIRILGLLLGALAQDGGLLLVLEDLHWLDAASREMLNETLTLVPGTRTLVLATRRPEGEPLFPTEPWAGTLPLAALAEDDAASLAGAVLGGMPLAPSLVGYLRDRAHGNPFYIEELLHFLQDVGGLAEQEGEIDLRAEVVDRLPSTLAELLLARLDRLEGQVKGIAQVGSVIGRSFVVRILAQVLDREEAAVAPPLQVLQDAAITFPREGGELEHVFRHVLLRDAAYSMLVQRRKRQLHLAVGRAIAQLYPAEESVEMIAYHFARTDEDVEAAGWLERAGDRARDTYALLAAIEHYRGTLERLERTGAAVGRLARVEVELSWVLQHMARYEEAAAVCERALERYRDAGDLEGAGRAAEGRGLVLAEQGRLEEARELLEETAALLTDRATSRTAARLQSTLAGVFQGLGRYREMLEAAERGLELARVVEDAGSSGRAEERRGTALNHLGRIEEAHAALERAIPLLEEAGDLVSLGGAVGNLGATRWMAGNVTEALRLQERALELAIRTGNVRNEMFFHLTVANMLVTVGEWERARRYVERAEAIAAERQVAARVAGFFPLARGELALREGDWDAARAQLERAVDVAAGANQAVLQYTECALAELAILEGRPQEAQTRLEPMMDGDEADLPLMLPVLAWSALERGEIERGLELAARAESDVRARQILLRLPEALRIKGIALRRVGRIEEARETLAEGRERAASMPNPYTEARIVMEMGLLDLHDGQEERARAHLEDALTSFGRLGARRDVESTEQHLRSLTRAPGSHTVEPRAL